MIFRSKKGIALILAISSISMLSIMMIEFTFNTRLNLQIANNFKNSIKAKELAKSGIHFATLELIVYKNIRENPLIKNIPGFQEGTLDALWQFGFIYPPISSKKSTFGTQKAMKEAIKTSKTDGKIRVEISDESSKINLNDLENMNFRGGILQQLDSIFEQKKSADELFYDTYRDLKFEELVNNIIDWIDKDRDKVGGGDEETYYSRLSPPYKPKNAPLDTVSELALIEGFDRDEIFDLLLHYVTVYSTGGVNVNTADATILKSISPELTFEDVESILEQRQSVGYFKDPKSFEDYCKNTLLKSAAFNTDPKVPLITRSHIFSMTSTAEVKGTQETVRAVVDINRLLPDGSPEILYWNLK